MGKGLAAWAATHAPDVLCLQEIKARPEQLTEADMSSLTAVFPHIAWNPAVRPGYSGVASLARGQPQEVRQGMEIPEFDGEGRMICTRHPGFLLYNIYFPNGGRDHERVPFKLDFYARLLELCDRLHFQGENIILCGDFNTCHQEIDLRNPKENANSTGFMPEERLWIDHYLEHGFVDAYRRLYPERVEYTWWTYRMGARERNVGWRLDYFLVSEKLMERVEDVVIQGGVLGSDHCPVTLVLKD
jgi:exodeoxyribonuclease III